MKLLLWDVDHTLIESGGVGSEVFGYAFERATGRPMNAGMAEAAGHTEPVLFARTLEINGVEPSEEYFPDFARAQAEGYRIRLPDLCDRGRALPGVPALLRTLARRTDVIQTVLTGNTRVSARIKLEAFGLDPYLQLDVGAYGDDDSDRPALVTIARKRVQAKHGIAIALEDTVLIGDTPRDIEAARAAGARVVAVATGSSSLTDLENADLALPGLAEDEDVDSLLHFLS